MKKIQIICVSLFLLAGCSQTPSASAPSVQEKAVNTTLTGVISATGGKFFIQSAGKPMTELDSYTVKLDQYIGRQVSVTGQYSGTTLFVDTIE